MEKGVGRDQRSNTSPEQKTFHKSHRRVFRRRRRKMVAGGIARERNKVIDAKMRSRGVVGMRRRWVRRRMNPARLIVITENGVGL